MPKMNVNAFLQKDYENETAFRPKKTNPIKPNFFKGQNRLPENLPTPFQAAHGEQLFTLGPKRLQFANQSSVSCLPKQWQQL